MLFRSVIHNVAIAAIIASALVLNLFMITTISFSSLKNRITLKSIIIYKMKNVNRAKVIIFTICTQNVQIMNKKFSFIDKSYDNSDLYFGRWLFDISFWPYYHGNRKFSGVVRRAGVWEFM